MSDLEFVAFSDDGKMIILQSLDGSWIEVPIKDSPTSYALPEERPTETELSPREIQSRIRAGISPAELAASTNSSLERIMSFAPPILLERSHVAAKATKTVIRRASGSGTLGDIVELKLESLGVDLESASWDSYRREDGRWTVLLHYPADGLTRTAAWLFDVRNNALVAADEDARWLTGDQHRQTAEIIQEDFKDTQVVEFLAPVTQLKASQKPESVDTAAVSTQVESDANSNSIDPAIDELLEIAPAETVKTDMASTSSQPTTEISEANTTENVTDFFESEPDTLASEIVETESDLDGDAEQPKGSSNIAEVTEIRPPKIPSWDEILFGPSSPEN